MRAVLAPPTHGSARVGGCASTVETLRYASHSTVLAHRRTRAPKCQVVILSHEHRVRAARDTLQPRLLPVVRMRDRVAKALIEVSPVEDDLAVVGATDRA